MDALIKLFSSLKEYWKTIVITLICNALTIYLICFLTVPDFKNYEFSKEVALSIIGSLFYSTIFYSLSTILLIPWFFVNRLIDFNTKCITKLNFIASIIVLIALTTYELILMIFIEEYSFNIIRELKVIASSVLLPTIMAFGEYLKIKRAEKRNKRTPKN
ncbi:hypothetical protein DW204_10065 [Phocaeicola plebeius]|jgi:hypothetical protein|uniref:Uncharacterized protein n=1 Tax=Phocaeicola plebeius TaxID=310297 RepID=A0A414WWU7_9BACT|nr:hypothetical protein [Phocaeicola plebeius]RHH43183.1 hypothetical protein DW204_10065 [Phocaeicola plebeius]